MITNTSFCNERLAANYLGVSVAFLRKARSRGTVGKATPGPPFFRLGRIVKYAQADLDAWREARRIDPSGRKNMPLRRSRI